MPRLLPQIAFVFGPFVLAAIILGTQAQPQALPKAKSQARCVTVEQWMERSTTEEIELTHDGSTDDAEFVNQYVANTAMNGMTNKDNIVIVHLVTVSQSGLFMPSFAILATDAKGCGVGWFSSSMMDPAMHDLSLHLAERSDGPD